jgi:hypothetical protein
MKISKLNKLTVPEVIERFRAYHQQPGNIVWGSLHLVLEDRNLKDYFVNECVKYALERGDNEGAALGEILLKMSLTQRGRIASDA